MFDVVQQVPPLNIMGVENLNEEHPLTWHVDYLRVTVWQESGIDPLDMIEPVISGVLGSWVHSERGRYFYSQSLRASLGASVYFGGTDDLRFTLELPGMVCQLLGYEKLTELYQAIARTSKRFTVTRLDTAFDYVPFSPQMFASAVLADEGVRSYFKRDNVKIYAAPHEKNEAGGVGTFGVTIGGRSSTRYLRCYDAHGYSRLEIEYKAEKADQVAADLFLDGSDISMAVAMGHLLDYIDIDASWWQEFKQGFDRAYKKLETSIDVIEAKKIAGWLIRQAASAIAVLHQLGYEAIDSILLEKGQEKMYRSKRYASLLYPAGQIIDFENWGVDSTK